MKGMMSKTTRGRNSLRTSLFVGIALVLLFVLASNVSPFYRTSTRSSRPELVRIAGDESDDHDSKALASSSKTGTIDSNKDRSDRSSKGNTVLVLGSGGLVGSALTTHLRNEGYRVVEVRNRYDADLRLEGSLDRFKEEKIDFCFYLACEVGGSKFLGQGTAQEMIRLYNERMYQTVFPFLEAQKIPFLFASSQLSNTPEDYGVIKKLGEHLTSQSSTGKSFRFWNVFGSEPVGPKSHVLADWVHDCLLSGKVSSLTDGTEQRQFVYNEDMAVGLQQLMENFDKLPNVTDITSGQWMSMREVSKLLLSLDAMKHCKLSFSTNPAKYQKGAEPVDPWVVQTNIEAGLQKMASYYQSKSSSDMEWQQRKEVYLSVILATTNDDFNGIRKRYFKFLHLFASIAHKVELDYELIVVQYNPSVKAGLATETSTNSTREKELPISMLFPFTAETVGAKMRIITVPDTHHKFDDRGHFWEYIAKNVGARRARGRFLLFTNPDDIFPRGMLAWLSKEQLQNDAVYRAGMLLDFVAEADDMATTLSKCETIAMGLGLCRQNFVCLGSQARRKDYRNYYIGDFTLFPRQLFLDSKGFIEIDQNSHVESEHLKYVLREFHGVREVYFDDSTCHQKHDRMGRPVFKHYPGKIASLYPGDDSFGLPGIELPETMSSSMLEMAYNPETPLLFYKHDKSLGPFLEVGYEYNFNASHLVDFVGSITSYVYDCENFDRYRKFHLSRSVPCDRHDEFVRQGFGNTTSFLGDAPIIDEEYFEWISAATTILDFVESACTSTPYVVAEFGARYGTWVVRGAKALKLLQPDGEVRIVAVEGDSTGYRWMREHVAQNDLSNVSELLNGLICSNDKNGTLQAGVVWEKGSVRDSIPCLSVMHALQNHQVIHQLHVDIQGFERVFLEQGTLSFLDNHVVSIYFGTHTEQVHSQLRNAFQSLGWTIAMDVKGSHGKEGAGRIEETNFGPVRFQWDGILWVQNSKLKQNMCMSKS